MDLDAAWSLLKEFTLKEFRGLGAPYVASAAKRDVLRTAMKLVYAHPWVPAGWVPPALQAAAAAAAPQAVAAPPSTAPSSPSSSDAQASPPASSYGGEVLIGVVAGDAKLGVRALRDWCWALGLPYVKPVSRVDGAAMLAGIRGPVYVKYNSKTQVAYVSGYTGRDRGVLIQLGSEQLGHFPLGLMDEAMANPPPEL